VCVCVCGVVYCGVDFSLILIIILILFNCYLFRFLYHLSPLTSHSVTLLPSHSSRLPSCLVYLILIIKLLVDLFCSSSLLPSFAYSFISFSILPFLSPSSPITIDTSLIQLILTYYSLFCYLLFLYLFTLISRTLYSPLSFFCSFLIVTCTSTFASCLSIPISFSLFPLSYAVSSLISFFSSHPRAFLQGNYLPPITTHGTPRRTLVIVLAQASLFLFEFGCVTLGLECVSLADMRYTVLSYYTVVLYHTVILCYTVI
jgi:hypothetical protein